MIEGEKWAFNLWFREKPTARGNQALQVSVLPKHVLEDPCDLRKMNLLCESQKIEGAAARKDGGGWMGSLFGGGSRDL